MSDKETLAAARAPNLGAPTYMASAPEERAAKPHSTFPAGASSSSWIGEGVDAKEKKIRVFLRKQGLRHLPSPVQCRSGR